MAFEKVGVEATVKGLGQYKTAAGQIEASNKRLGQSAVAAGEKASGFGKALKAIGTIATGVIAARGMMMIPQILGGITSTARDLELQMKKANIVFGEQIGVVEDWATANAHAMGLTRREAVAAGAAFADLLIPMGFTREAATDMTTSVLGLSGALAEWSGGTRSAAEVSRILAKAMLGEREQLKELGISITEAEVQGRLLEKGQKDLTGAMLQQAKAVATQELLFEKSTDAQTAYADGAGTAARKQAELTAKFNEAKETVALALAPAISELLGLVTKLTPIVEGASRGFETLASVLGQVLGVIEKYKILLAALVVAMVAMPVASFARDFVMLIRAFGVANVAAATLRGTMVSLYGAMMGPVGLVIAIGAVIAALVGLEMMMGRTEGVSKRVRQEMEAAAAQAAGRGLNPQIEQLKVLAAEYEEVIRQAEAYAVQGGKGELIARALVDGLGDLRKETTGLGIDYRALFDEVEAGNISLETARGLLPDFAKWLDEGGDAAEGAAEGVGALGDEADAAASPMTELGKAIDDATAAMRGQEDVLRRLTGIESQEEKQLIAWSAALDANIKVMEARIAAGEDLTAAEEEQLDLWEAMKDATDAKVDAYRADKDATVKLIDASRKGLPTYSELVDLIGKVGDEVIDLSEDEATATGATSLLDRFMQAFQDSLEGFSAQNIVGELYRVEWFMRQVAAAGYDASTSILDLQRLAFQAPAALEMPKGVVRVFDAIRKAREEMDKSIPPFRYYADAADGAGDAAEEAAEQVRDLGEALSEAFTEDILAGLEAVPAGIREVISEAGEALEAFSASWRPQMEEIFVEVQDLAVLGPQVPESYRAAAEAMGELEDVVAYVGAALANQRQEQATLAAALWEAEFIYDELASAVQRYTDEIEEANDSLRRFANAQLEGTAAFEEAMFAIEQAISRKRLEIVNAELAGNEERVEALREELQRLRLEAEALDLQREIETAPLERDIESLLEDTEELTFEEIIAGIKEAKARIEDAEPKLEDLNELLGIQEGKVSDAKEAFDKQGETIDATEKLYEQLARTLGTFEQAMAQETDSVLRQFAWIMWKTNETDWTILRLRDTIRQQLQPALNSINTDAAVSEMDDLTQAALAAIDAANRATSLAAVEAGLGVAGYQFGGVVPGPVGSPMLAVVHGGERIIPAGNTSNYSFSGDIVLPGVRQPADFVPSLARELGRLQELASRGLA